MRLIPNHICTLYSGFQACRPVFCPGLQMARADTTCTAEKGLTANSYNVCLNLTFVPSVTEKTFLEIIENPRRLLKKWSIFWEIGITFYKVEFNYISHAILKISTAMHEWEMVMIEIKKNIGSSWVDTHGNMTFTVSQTFSRYCRFIIYKGTTTDRLMAPNSLIQFQKDEGFLFVNITDFLYKMKIIFHALNSKVTYILTTKLAFCKQVDVQHSEALLMANGAILFINKTSTFLFENEFVVSFDRKQDRVFRVCLEDFYYTKLRDVVANHSPRLSFFLYLVFTCIACLFYFI